MAARSLTTTLPSEADVRAARDATRTLQARRKKSAPIHLQIPDGPSTATVKLPAPAVSLLLRILQEMAHGNAVTILPVQAELTTQQAADILNISRPSLIQLLEQGKISSRKVGTHRRVLTQSLMRYKRQGVEARLAALDELAAYDQELGI
jgi:excisionase family DNA binding protein